jgi:hypothetical protein
MNDNFSAEICQTQLEISFDIYLNRPRYFQIRLKLSVRQSKMVFAYCLVEIGKLQVTDKDNKGVLINLIKILAGLN